MLHLVEEDYSASEDDVLRAMFAARKEVFADLLHWDINYPPEVASQFDPELAALVGYRQHRPNLGNFEGQCPSVHVPERIGSIDALRPDQQQLVEAYVAGQRGSS